MTCSAVPFGKRSQRLAVAGSGSKVTHKGLAGLEALLKGKPGA